MGPRTRSEAAPRSIAGDSPRPERPHSAARLRPAPGPSRQPRRARWQPPRSPAPAPCLGWGCAPRRRLRSSTRPPSSSLRRCGGPRAIAGCRSPAPEPAPALGASAKPSACRHRFTLPPPRNSQHIYTRPQVCRCLPWVVDNYRLDELTTVPELRRNLAGMFRKYTDVQVGGRSVLAGCCACVCVG